MHNLHKFKTAWVVPVAGFEAAEAIVPRVIANGGRYGWFGRLPATRASAFGTAVESFVQDDTLFPLGVAGATSAGFIAASEHAQIRHNITHRTDTVLGKRSREEVFETPNKLGRFDIKRERPESFDPPDSFDPAHNSAKRPRLSEFYTPTFSTMAYRRRSSRRYRRRRLRRGRYSRRSYRRLNRRTGGLIGQEIKYVDAALTTFNVGASTTAGAGAVNVINTLLPTTNQPLLGCVIAQGAGVSERIGKKVHLLSLQIKAALKVNPDTDSTGNYIIDLWLILDKEANGTNPTAAEVFEDPSIVQSGFTNISNSSRFKILKHWCTAITPQAGVNGAYPAQIKCMEYYRKLRLRCDYSSTTGVISELRNNNLVFASAFRYTNVSGGNPTHFPYIEYNARLRYLG